MRNTRSSVAFDDSGRPTKITVDKLTAEYLYFGNERRVIYSGRPTALSLELLKSLQSMYVDKLQSLSITGIDDLNHRGMIEEWLADGSYTERWEQGFRKQLYHGRTGAYYRSESAVNVDFDKWTLPKIKPNSNTFTAAENPWKNSILMRNEKPTNIGTMDAVYVGFPKAHIRQAMTFEAKLPSVGAGKPDNLYVGFEVNSGGAGAGLACLTCLAGQWQLYAINPYRLIGGYNQITSNVTLNYPDQWARYVLWFDPPFFELLQSTVADVGLLERAAVLDLQEVRVKGIPFMANEDTTALSEFEIGDIWIYELENPRPKRMKTVTGRINATTLLGIKAAGYLAKIHSFIINSESDNQTVYFYEETSGTKLGLSMPLNAREGYSVAHTLIQAAVLGKDIGLNLAAASFVNYTIEYSNDDFL